jgi:hypothetical protein
MAVRGANYRRVADDLYPTPPEVVEALLKLVKFGRTVCDPACGPSHNVLRVLRRHGHATIGMDKANGFDFTRDEFPAKRCDIVTNPPYGDRRAALALAFVERSLAITERWRGRVAMLLPVDFDSGKTRCSVFRDCPCFDAKIVLLDRIRWFDGQSGSTNHAWYVWNWKRDSAMSPRILYSRIEERQ